MTKKFKTEFKNYHHYQKYGCDNGRQSNLEHES